MKTFTIHAGRQVTVHTQSPGALTVVKAETTNDKVSDGYHTFADLYQHRYALMLALMRTVSNNPRQGAWVSKLHYDGTMFDDSFIAGVDTPSGPVIYHMPLRLWEAAIMACKGNELPRGPRWDGAGPEETVKRLMNFACPGLDDVRRPATRDETVRRFGDRFPGRGDA